ncbi:MAG: hypothetical protein QOE68_4073 [Thermoanaerobaculia bacterium]|jgi:hypothetical protein|nr:hypothetical protein [Thermoanaerobaculia bacterium]
MAKYGDVLAALGDYRNELHTQTHEELSAQFASASASKKATATAFSAQGGVSAFATSLTNVHATGVGIRVRKGKVQQGEFVIKVFVFDKQDLGAATPEVTKSYNGVEVDVEHLPIQSALAAAAIPPNRRRRRPIPGGVSVAPLNAPFVGTLSGFLRRVSHGVQQTFALSNNHVFADVNSLPAGTQIVQPGPEVGPSQPGDVFAALSAFIPIQFPSASAPAVTNRFDAAIAIVSNLSLIRTGSMLGIANYTPTLLAPVPGMRVTKSGRTTGVTTGVITATHVNGVHINYGTQTHPRIAIFNDTIEIVGDGGVPFSNPGDSGSLILDRASGRPVALLFAGDGRTTTACDIGGVCQEFQALPV